MPAHSFKVGTGYADVIPRQIVRTADDRLYIFAGQAQESNNILVYWTTAPGVPTSAADFGGNTQLTPPLTKYPISVDAVYDGNTIIHVLINENCTSPFTACAPDSGELYDYPFDITTNTFRPARLISTGNSVAPGLYLGSGGVSGLFDTNGVLHVAYWAGSNHIDYAAFTYDAAADTLTQIDSLIHVDNSGSANHPILAVSPVDNSVTIAWVSQASSHAQILARTKTAAGWGADRVGWSQRSECERMDQHELGHQRRSRPGLAHHRQWHKASGLYSRHGLVRRLWTRALCDLHQFKRLG